MNTSQLSFLQYRLAQVYHSRFAYAASFLLMTVQRSPVALHLGKLQQLLGRPFVQLARVATPLTAFFGGAHAVTGATGVVPASTSVNPATATVGESFTWVFRVSGQTAKSYSVSGLPTGITKSSQVLSGGVSSISGVPEEAGEFVVEIIGWRNSNETGDKTPVYRLTLNVEGGAPPSIVSQPQGGSFEAGADAALTVGAEGSGLHYRWSKDGEEIPSTVNTWISQTSERKALVPTGPVDDGWRSALDFDDSSWQSGAGGVGYERSSANTYDPYFKLDVEGAAFGKNTTTLIRIPFILSEEDVKGANTLKFRVQYDDGYVAFLNGTEVSRANAPANPAWNSVATAGHDDALAVEFDEIDLIDHASSLKAGTNLLAIQLMNDSLSSSDLLCNVELVGGRNTDAPTLGLFGLSAADAGNYEVVVSNGAGTIRSDAATVQVSGEATGYALWSDSYWPGMPSLEDAAPLADPDGDGLSNLIEYAFDSDPLQARRLPATSVAVETSDNISIVELRFPRSQVVEVTTAFEMSTLLEPTAWIALEDGVDGVLVSHTDTESILRVPVTGDGGLVRMKAVQSAP